MKLRSPIVATLGHVDHGKTTLLDKIRATSVTRKEAGGITQHVGASYVSKNTILEICGEMLKRYGIEVRVPGLLFIDTPGHEAFVTLRKRGGAISDLAILVVDINQGFQPQTDESLMILKEYKVPFVVAATKIDVISGWKPSGETSFMKSVSSQSESAIAELEKKLYDIVFQLSQRGFSSERFDRVQDFTKEVAIVPCSGVTGEGIAELLLVLSGLAQKFLIDKLELSGVARGTVLEVKEMRGFGKVIDVILYDGILRKGDYLVIGGKQPVVTRVKALLVPRELQELRVEKQFKQVNEISAAAGVRLACVDLEGVIAGSSLIATSDEKLVETYVAEIKEEIAGIEFSKDINGVIVKADTVGSLEAMIKLLNDRGIPVRKAEIGEVTRQDIIEIDAVRNKEYRCVFAFNVKISEELKHAAKQKRIAVFSDNVIYRLMEAYDTYRNRLKEIELKEKLSSVTWPGKIRVLPGHVFRASKPAIVGVEVLTGKIKPGVVLVNERGREIGTIKEIQSEGVSIEEAKRGDRVAVSISDAALGRGFREGDVLFTKLNSSDIALLKGELLSMLGQEEIELIEKIKEILGIPVD